MSQVVILYAKVTLLRRGSLTVQAKTRENTLGLACCCEATCSALNRKPLRRRVTQRSYLFFTCDLNSCTVIFANLSVICSTFISLKSVHLFECIILLTVKVTKFRKDFWYLFSFVSILSPETISFSFTFSGYIAVKSI